MHQGKAQYCKQNAIQYLVDDRPEIVAECAQKGVYTYNINTRHYKHTAGHWVFWEAANLFLLDQHYNE